MLDVLTAIGLVWTGGAAGFVLGCAWRSWVYHEAPPSVHAIDSAYKLGVADEKARREAEIAGLEGIVRR